MIYINGEEVKPYLGDYKPLTVYKGTEKLAGWVENTTEISSNIRIENGYSTMKVKPFGKSEQVQTEQSANLCPNVDSDKWVLSGGAYKENGYIVLPQVGAKAEMVVEWNGQVAEDDGFFKCYWGANMVTEDTENGKYLVETIYLNENKEVITSNGNRTLIGGNDVWKNLYFAYSADTTYGQAIRDAKYIRYRITYGSSNTVPYKFKDPMISKSACATYVEFVPDSPSPNYPSKIENVSGDLEVKVVGKNLFNINEVKQAGGESSTEINGNILTLTATGTLGAQYSQYFLKNVNFEKTYIFSFKVKKIVAGNNSLLRVMVGGSNDGKKYTFIKNIDKTGAQTNVEYSLSGTFSGYSHYKFYIYNNVSTPVIIGEQTKYYNMQIEEGTVSTECEPYKEQTVKFPLGTQKLMKDGYLGDDGIHNKRKQVVLTGNETIGKNSSYIQINVQGGAVWAESILSNYFKSPRNKIRQHWKYMDIFK